MVMIAAVMVFIAITGYALFGGADFGAGFWDLVAGGTKRGEHPREFIETTIGPVWEANHVWLIFYLVVMWTCFPEAYASIMLTVYVPLSIAALGVVLRGSSFAFRHAVVRMHERRAFGAVFATSSVLVPFCMGAVAGAIGSCRIPPGGVAGDPWTSWLNPTSIVSGILAVTSCAFLAGVYLVSDARRMTGDGMGKYFRVRAIITGILTGVIAALGIVVLASDAPFLFDGFKTRALPLVVLAALTGITSVALLIRDTPRGPKVFAAASVTLMVVSWIVAHRGYILPDSLTLSDAASPSGTILAVFIATILAVIVVIPAIILLFILHQKGLLHEEGVAEGVPATE